jgi:hypothetical protein
MKQIKKIKMTLWFLIFSIFWKTSHSGSDVYYTYDLRSDQYILTVLLLPFSYVRLLFSRLYKTLEESLFWKQVCTCWKNIILWSSIWKSYHWNVLSCRLVNFLIVPILHNMFIFQIWIVAGQVVSQAIQTTFVNMLTVRSLVYKENAVIMMLGLWFCVVKNEVRCDSKWCQHLTTLTIYSYIIL